MVHHNEDEQYSPLRPRYLCALELLTLAWNVQMEPPLISSCLFLLHQLSIRRRDLLRQPTRCAIVIFTLVWNQCHRDQRQIRAQLAHFCQAALGMGGLPIAHEVGCLYETHQITQQLGQGNIVLWDPVRSIIANIPQQLSEHFNHVFYFIIITLIFCPTRFLERTTLQEYARAIELHMLTLDGNFELRPRQVMEEFQVAVQLEEIFQLADPYSVQQVRELHNRIRFNYTEYVNFPNTLPDGAIFANPHCTLANIQGHQLAVVDNNQAGVNMQQHPRENGDPQAPMVNEDLQRAVNRDLQPLVNEQPPLPLANDVRPAAPMNNDRIPQVERDWPDFLMRDLDPDDRMGFELPEEPEQHEPNRDHVWFPNHDPMFPPPNDEAGVRVLLEPGDAPVFIPEPVDFVEEDFFNRIRHMLRGRQNEEEEEEEEAEEAEREQINQPPANVVEPPQNPLPPLRLRPVVIPRQNIVPMVPAHLGPRLIGPVFAMVPAVVRPIMNFYQLGLPAISLPANYILRPAPPFGNVVIQPVRMPARQRSRSMDERTRQGPEGPSNNSNLVIEAS